MTAEERSGIEERVQSLDASHQSTVLNQKLRDGATEG